MQLFQNSILQNRTINPLKRSLFISSSKDQNGKAKKMVHLDQNHNLKNAQILSKVTPCKSQTYSQKTIESISQKSKYMQQKSDILQRFSTNVFNSNSKQNLVQNLFQKNNTLQIKPKVSKEEGQGQTKLTLLETCKPVQFSQSQKQLMKIQMKLDETLLFLKENRKKYKGQFFSVIKRIILQSSNMLIQTQHVKRIMFVDDLYIIKKQKIQNQNNFLIGLKDGKCTLQERRQNFKNKLAKLVQKDENYIQKKQNSLQIPEAQLQYQKDVEVKQKVDSKKTVIKSIIMQKQKAKAMHKMWIFKKKSDQQTKKIEEKLTKKIQKKQEILKLQRELKALNGSKEVITKKQINRIVQQIQLMYLTKNVNNILLKQLVQYIGNKLIMADQNLERIIKRLLSICEQNKCYFIKQIIHKQESVIQIDKGLLNDMKNFVQDKQEIILQVVKQEQEAIPKMRGVLQSK